MSYKEKIIKELRKGYTIDPISPNDELNSIFDHVFKPVVKRKDLAFLIDIFEMNEPILRAWSFLGIYLILQEEKSLQEDIKRSIQNVIKEILHDNREIIYYGGSCEIHTSLREHHARRIPDLENSIVFEPVFEYCKSFDGEPDIILGELLEKIVSKSKNSDVLPILIKHSKNVPDDNFTIKINIINTFENLGNESIINDKMIINDIFKKFLKDVKEDTSESIQRDDSKRALISSQKKRLRESIFKAAAILDLDLEEETLIFVDSVKFPFGGLVHIAHKFRKNKRFKEILLNKLNSTNNPNLIIEILRAIIILKEEVINWKGLVLENIEKYNVVDGKLMEEMQQTDLLNETMILNYLSKGNRWQLDFIREYLDNNPEKINEWNDLRHELISILETFNDDETLLLKKEFALKVILDLENKDLVHLCLDNFINLKNEELKKFSLFAIINQGSEELMFKLKQYLNENDEDKAFFKKFWRHIKTREWKYYY